MRRRKRELTAADFVRSVARADSEPRTGDAAKIHVELLEDKLPHRYGSNAMIEWFAFPAPTEEAELWFAFNAPTWRWERHASRFVRIIP